jgi:hypothetical protein
MKQTRDFNQFQTASLKSGCFVTNLPTLFAAALGQRLFSLIIRQRSGNIAGMKNHLKPFLFLISLFQFTWIELFRRWPSTLCSASRSTLSPSRADDVRCLHQ